MKRKNMNTIDETENVNIDNLLRISKRVQNKMRQEFEELNASHGRFSERDVHLLTPKVTDMNADHMIGSSRKKETLDCPNKTDLQTNVRPKVNNDPKMNSRNFAHSQAKNNTDLAKNSSPQCLNNSLLTMIRSQEESKKKLVASKSSKKNPEIRLKKKRELPLQRFVGSFVETIDFSKEHPNLTLYTNIDQSTVFPRRFLKNSMQLPEQVNCLNGQYVNLAEAKMRPPRIVTPETVSPTLKILSQNEKHISCNPVRRTEKNTWKEVLRKNCSSEKPKKIVQGKKTETAHTSLKKPAEDDLKKIDIISTPYKGLYHLEKNEARLLKQNKCSRQCLPVMCIRPKCRVQQVASISIVGNCSSHEYQKRLEESPPNVGYVECWFEKDMGMTTGHEEEQTLDRTLHVSEPFPKKAEEPVPPENGQEPSKATNKFIDALKCVDVLSSKSKQSKSGLEKVKMLPSSDADNGLYSTFTTLTSIEKEDDESKTSAKEIFNRTSSKTTRSTQCGQRDVYVQTDITEPTSNASLSTPIEYCSVVKELLEKGAKDTDDGTFTQEHEADRETSSSVKESEQSQTHGKGSFFEDNLTSRLLQRMHIDSSADRHKDSREQKSKCTETNTSRERLPQRRKKKLFRHRLRAESSSDEKSGQSSYRPYEHRKLDQEPVKISVQKAREKSQEPPMQKEIKRAVNIFLKSLAFEDEDFYSGHKNTRQNQFSPLHLLDPPRNSTNRHNVPNSSPSFSSENETEEILRFSDEFSFSSILSSSSSKGGNTLQKSRSESFSEGEVLSIGEV